MHAYKQKNTSLGAPLYSAIFALSYRSGFAIFGLYHLIWPVCSHEGCSNFFCSPGRSTSSVGLVGRHQSSLSRVGTVVYYSWRHCREQRRQRASHRAPDHQKLWGRPTKSRNRLDIQAKMSQIANYYQKMIMVKYCDFLVDLPGRYTDMYSKANLDCRTDLSLITSFEYHLALIIIAPITSPPFVLAPKVY